PADLLRRRRALARPLRIQAARRADPGGRAEHVSQAIAHWLPIGRGGGQIAVISIKGSGGTLSRNAGEGREGVVVSNNVPEKHRAYARSLRRGMTDAERLVWSKVRAHRLAGLGFRRQVPMLGFIAD